MDRAKMLNDIIRNRRSYYPKQYSEKVIPDDIISEIMENAIWAPTHKLTQPWRFKIFSGEGKKTLGDFQSELYKQKSQKKGTFKEDTYNSLRNKPLLASHIIAIGMVRDPKEKIPEIEEVCAVACAVQNIALGVHAYGYGGYWGTGGITYFDEAKSFFDLDSRDKLLGFFYIGIPEKKREIPGKRIPLIEKSDWIKN